MCYWARCCSLHLQDQMKLLSYLIIMTSSVELLHLGDLALLGHEVNVWKSSLNILQILHAHILGLKFQDTGTGIFDITPAHDTKARNR